MNKTKTRTPYALRRAASTDKRLTAPPPAAPRLCWFTLLATLWLSAAAAQAATDTWTGASGTDTNWSNSSNWDMGVPGSAEDVLFSDAGVVLDSSVNNLVDFSTTINSLTYSQSGSTAYQNTYIADGQTLTIANLLATNALFVGTGIDSGNVDTLASISGPNGALLVTASNGVFKVRQGGLNHFAGTASLDMSGLSNAAITVKSILIAGDGSNALDGNGGRPADRPSGTWRLAQTSTLTALAAASANPPGFTVGYTIGNNSQVLSGVVLGQTNYIYSDSGMAVGMVRVPATMTFNGMYPNAQAVFRDVAGTGRQSKWLIGDASLGASLWGSPTVGSVDFSGSGGLSGYVDAKLDQLFVGRSKSTTESSGSQATGTLSFDSGIVDVNTLTIGYQMQDYSPAAQGTVNVRSVGGVPAQLVVNTSLQLGRFMAAEATNGLSSAYLNIDGGAVTVNGNITTTTSPANPDNDSEISLSNGGSLYVKGTVGPVKQLTLGSGTTNVFDLGTSLNPLTPICVVSNLATSFPVYLTVKGNALDLGTIQVIKYGSYGLTDASDFVGAVQGTAFGYFTNNTATLSIDLVITNTATFSWNGRTNGVNIGNWDVGITPNWKSGASAVVYATTDNALFDDSAQGTTAVNILADIPPPTTIFKNSSKNYTLTGAGGITGAGGLSKTGAGTVTLGNSGVNTFTTLTINGGTVQAAGSPDRVPTNAAVTIANAAGATLDLNGQNQSIASLTGTGPAGEVKLGAGTLTVRGTASTTFGGIISGAGSLLKTNSGTLILTSPNTYTGGTVISNFPSTASVVIVQNTTGSGLGGGTILVGTNGLLRIGNGTAAGMITNAVINTLGHPYSGTFGVDLNRNDNWTFTNFLAGTSQLFKNNGSVQQTTVTIGTSNSFSGLTTISSGALRITHPYALGASVTPSRAWSTFVNNGNSARLELANNITVAEQILLASRTGSQPGVPEILSVSGTNTLTGRITLTTGGTVYNFQAAAGSKLILGVNSIAAFSGLITGTPYYELGGAGDGEIFAGLTNGFNNSIALTNSLYMDGTGTWTLWGANTYIGATTITNGTLVVNGSVAGGGVMGNSPSGMIWKDCNVLPLGTLRGTGQITPAVTNAGTLAPGTASAIGTLTVNNSLTLRSTSTNIFRVSQTGTTTNDQVAGISTVKYGGKLKVSLAGTLVGGEIFKLFSAAAYDPTPFDSYDLPVIPAPLSWDTTQLTVDGTLRVNGAIANENIGVTSVGLAPDHNFQMGGSSVLTNWNYRVLATTNPADPLMAWPQVGSGSFAAGVFSFIDLTSTNYPKRFYRVVAP